MIRTGPSLFTKAGTSKKSLLQRYFSSKITSDEKLLNEILKEERDTDLDAVDALDKNRGNSSYRKSTHVAEVQKNDAGTNSAAGIPSLGPKYWKNQFRKSYRKVEKGLVSPLDTYIAENMDVIESYNKKHKRTVEERIKVNINKQLRWDDVIPNRSLCGGVIRYLKKNSKPGEYVKLTSFQQRFFALMSGFGSTVAKGSSGSGKSLSLLISALSLRRSRTRGPGINSLILVKSNALVFQYERVLNNILSEMGRKSYNSKAIAQFLYRGTPEEEMKQDDNLTDFQCPHILITTPQRLLDILSSRGMDFVKINSLSFVGVDDFTSMIDEIDLLETDKKPPVVKLLDYVLKLQDYRRQHNDPHPQVVLMADDSATENLLLQLKEYTKWISWKTFAPIGKFGEEEDVPYYKYVSTGSAVSTVLVQPRFMDDTKNNKFKVSLFDMKQFNYGDTPSVWLEKLYRKTFGNSQVYKKHRNSKWTNIPLEVKKGELEILCSGLGKLLKKKAVSDWTSNNPRSLVVHADEVNSNLVVDILKRKTGRKVELFDFKNGTNLFKENLDEHTEAELYVTNISSLTGITLPGLKTVFVLGVDTIRNVTNLAAVMGRCRDECGLVPENEYSVFSKEANIDDDFTPRARTFIVNAMQPDGTVDPFERNFLERAFIVNGLVKQLNAIGVEEPWTEMEMREYESTIGGGGGSSAVDDGYGITGNLEFGEIYQSNSDTDKTS